MASNASARRWRATNAIADGEQSRKAHSTQQSRDCCAQHPNPNLYHKVDAQTKPEHRPDPTRPDPAEPVIFTMNQNCIGTPARRWRAIRRALVKEKLKERQADIQLRHQKTINASNRKRKLQNGPRIRDSTAPPTNTTASSSQRPDGNAPTTPRAKSTPISDLMAPRKAGAVVDPTLTTPVQASEPTRVTQEFRNGKVTTKKSQGKGQSETHEDPIPHAPAALADNGGQQKQGDDKEAELATPTRPPPEDDATMDDSFLSELASKHPDVTGEEIQVDRQFTNQTTNVPAQNDDPIVEDQGKSQVPQNVDKADAGAGHDTEMADETKPTGGEAAIQSMRGVEIKRAKAEFEEVRDLYNTLKARVDKLQEKAAKGAIDAQLYILMNTLKDLNESMLDAENELLTVMTSAHPEVIFVPSVFVPATQPTNSAQATSSDKKKRKHSKTSGKRRKSSDASQKGKYNYGHYSKKKRKMRASDFAMDEAIECNKESRSDIGVKAKRPRIQSKEFVEEDDMPSKEDVPPEVEVVIPTDKSKKRNKNSEKGGDEDGDGDIKKKVIIPELYRKGMKPDLALLIKDITRDEANEVKNFREQLIGFQWNWGEVMTISVSNVVNSWSFDKRSFEGKPRAADLAPHLDYVKALVDDHDLMEKRLQTSPRIMQLSALDPFFTDDSIIWDEVVKSAQYPHNSEKNGVFRALHAMSCRDSDNPIWTSTSKLNLAVKSGYMILHNILAEALEFIAYDATHDNITIDTDGEYAIPKKFMAMSQTVGWLFHQINARSRSENGPRRDRVSSASIGSLQKQYFLVLTGMMLVYESDTYNREVDRNMRNKKQATSAAEFKQLKAIHKDQTVLRQLVNTQARYTSKRLKGVTGGSGSTVVKTKDQERKIAQTVNHDLSRFRGDAIQALALFLLYGTAAFFHVWPTPRENTQHDAALLINLASILADRRWAKVKGEKHVFGARAWNRLDDLMFRALKRFLNHNGSIKHEIDWPSMTDYFSRKFEASNLAYMFTLDLLMETHRPGLSRGINGLVAPHVKLVDQEMWLIDGPTTQSFRAIWGTTEGELVKASEGGSGLYPEVSKNGVRTPHATAETQMAEDLARANGKGKGRQVLSDTDDGSSDSSRTSGSSDSASNSGSEDGSESEEEDDSDGSSGSDEDVQL
ncbi:hypothetical protein DFH28DRAFT_1127573 [Melampsora americana]|nr:hypothetical protein DFH28DRAFT_1127573 [Melampsora americana]